MQPLANDDLISSTAPFVCKNLTAGVLHKFFIQKDISKTVLTHTKKYTKM